MSETVSPVKVFRPTASPVGTPDKELDNLALGGTDDGVSFSVIGVDGGRSNFSSLTPGPIYSRSPDACLSRRTPGAGEKGRLGVPNSGTDTLHHTGAFEHSLSLFNTPMMKYSLGRSYNSGSRLSPRCHDASQYLAGTDDSTGYYDKYGFSATPSDIALTKNSKYGSDDTDKDILNIDGSQSPSNINNLQSKVLHFLQTSTASERFDKSPTQYMIDRDLQAIMKSPATVKLGDENDLLSNTSSDIQQILFQDSEHNSTHKSPTVLHEQDESQERNVSISPGKNVHSAVFQPMGYSHQRSGNHSLPEQPSSQQHGNFIHNSGLNHPHPSVATSQPDYRFQRPDDPHYQQHESSTEDIQSSVNLPLQPQPHQYFQYSSQYQQKDKQYFGVNSTNYSSSFSDSQQLRHGQSNTKGSIINCESTQNSQSYDGHHKHQQQSVDYYSATQQPHIFDFHQAASTHLEGGRQVANQMHFQEQQNKSTGSSSTINLDQSVDESLYPTRSSSPPLTCQKSSYHFHPPQQSHHSIRSMANVQDSRTQNQNQHSTQYSSMQYAGNSGHGFGNSLSASASNLNYHNVTPTNRLRTTYPPSSAQYPVSTKSFDPNIALDQTLSNQKFFATVYSTPSSSNAAFGSSSGIANPVQRRNKDDPTKATRQDQVESPNSKAFYKSFQKQFNQRETVSVDDALRYAQEEVLKIPAKIKWRIYLDAADLLKRNNRIEEARYMYGLSCGEFAHVQVGWIDWSKLEEDCGNFDKSLKILRKGTRASPNYNEVIVMKAIKQHEKMNRLAGARDLLGELYNEPIEKIWRVVLEGALLEERAGNVKTARKLLTVLVQKVAWYGPIYYEAFRLEEKAELFDRAYIVIRKGLTELPRYGPLWFGLLRIMERRDIVSELPIWQSGNGKSPILENVRTECQIAIGSISRELVWKVHFEQAQIEERAAVVVAQSLSVATATPFDSCLSSLLGPSRKCLISSMLSCPSNLRWKIFLAGARMELYAGRIDVVKSLLRQAHIEVPEKSRYHVYLECSRLEEFVGSVDEARRILAIARSNIKNEWKIYLESVLVEARAGNITRSIYIADEALRMDSGSGRLWALLLQLIHRSESMKDILGTSSQKSYSLHLYRDALSKVGEIQVPSDYVIPSKFSVLSRALNVVPKSGEVWCEGGRLLLNPLCIDVFHPFQAMKYLSFAIMFTPQYGDSFLEYIRLEMLLQVVLPRVLAALGVPLRLFCRLHDMPDEDSDFLKTYLSECNLGQKDFYDHKVQSLHPCDKIKRKENMQLAIDGLLSLNINTSCYERVALKRLYRRCLNADPNYGTSWFYFRERPIDTPGAVIDSVHAQLNYELSLSEPLYVKAMVHFVASSLQTADPHVDMPNFNISEWISDWMALNPKSNSLCIAPLKNVNGLMTFCCQDFITGTVKLSRLVCATGRNGPSEDRREMLYGSDQITP